MTSEERLKILFGNLSNEIMYMNKMEVGAYTMILCRLDDELKISPGIFYKIYDNSYWISSLFEEYDGFFYKKGVIDMLKKESSSSYKVGELTINTKDFWESIKDMNYDESGRYIRFLCAQAEGRLTEIMVDSLAGNNPLLIDEFKKAYKLKK